MPYIRYEDRSSYDRVVQLIVDTLEDLPPEKLDGHLNYVITRILVRLYEPSYFNYNRVQGLLECIQHEFYRRLIAAYEDKKMDQHGDVYQE
jgi:hypothetical protein